MCSRLRAYGTPRTSAHLTFKIVPTKFRLRALPARTSSILIADYIDPIGKTISALASPQFYCAGVDCPSITVYEPPSTFVPTTKSDFVENAYGLHYSDRWADIGYLAV